MNIWHNIDSERIKPEDFIAVIEIPKSKKNTNDKETGLLILDRILYTSTHYPPTTVSFRRRMRKTGPVGRARALQRGFGTFEPGELLPDRGCENV